MKPAISMFSMALIAILSLSSLCPAQNVTINLQPINPPIQIPAPGGSFDYNVTVSNTGTFSQTFSAWIMVQLPSGSWYGPVLGPVNLTLPASASVSRQRTQPIPASAPAGTYVYEGRVGIYPNTVWNTSSFTFAKTLEGSEVWVARYNGPGNGTDEAYSLAVDGAGNVYVTGLSVGSGTFHDYATIKYNSAGIQQWIARYNGPGNYTDWAYSLAVDGSGNVYVTGYSSGSGTVTDYATIKYNSVGVQQWVTRYNGPGNSDDVAHSLALDGAGNVYVTGASASASSLYNADYATIKYNSAGVQQWEARYNGPGNGNDAAWSLAVDGTGNIYVTGYSIGVGSSFDYATIKYDSTGVQQWVARYNGLGGSDQATSLVLDQAGNVYVTGNSAGSGAHDDYATIKYNSAGVQQWAARYNGPGNFYDYAKSLAVDETGNVYVTGSSAGSGTADDYATIKYDAAGVQQWVERYNGPGNGDDWAYSLGLDEAGNVFVTGASAYDYATIKYDSAGVQQWVARYNGPGNYMDEAYSLALDGGGNVYVTGFSDGGGANYDYCTIKYSGGNPAVAGSNWQPVEALVFGAQEAVTEYQLNPCYPNPFNAETVASFELRVPSYVNLRVYDTVGRLVETLVDGWREAGKHELTFDGSNLPSGVYVYCLKAGGFEASGKMILMK